MVVLPAVTGVTVPVPASIVATLGLLLLQVPPAVASISVMLPAPRQATLGPDIATELTTMGVVV